MRSFDFRTADLDDITLQEISLAILKDPAADFRALGIEHDAQVDADPFADLTDHVDAFAMGLVILM